MSDFTIEELLAAMDDARVGEARGVDGVRVQELRELTGRSEATLTRQITPPDRRRAGGIRAGQIHTYRRRANYGRGIQVER